VSSIFIGSQLRLTLLTASMGFSCMGYEIAGAWGAAMARPHSQVLGFSGDGSYLMLNSEIYSSILAGHKFILFVLDNEGYAVIDRLQVGQGGASFNNMLETVHGSGSDIRVDFADHARSLGASTFSPTSHQELSDAISQARLLSNTSVIVFPVQPNNWTPGTATWQVGLPEVSDRETVRTARTKLETELKSQRKGI